MDNCIFCQIVKGSSPSWKVMESEHAYAFLDINPVNEYHTLVIPKKHYRDIFDIPMDELWHVMDLLKQVVDLYAEKLGIQNLQIVNNNGSEAQQDVFHIHYHIIPRYLGDGQSIRWYSHREYRERFDALLEVLK